MGNVISYVKIKCPCCGDIKYVDFKTVEKDDAIYCVNNHKPVKRKVNYCSEVIRVANSNF